jgi:hypothetical protein
MLEFKNDSIDLVSQYVMSILIIGVIIYLLFIVLMLIIKIAGYVIHDNKDYYL